MWADAAIFEGVGLLTDAAGADLNFINTVSAPAQTADQTLATAERDYSLAVAQADRDLAAGAIDAAAHSAVVAEAAETRDAAVKAAELQFDIAVRGAENTLAVDYAQTEVDFVRNTNAAEFAYATAHEAAIREIKHAESDAFTLRETEIAELDAAFAQREAEDQLIEIGDLPNAVPSPWSSREASLAQANRDKVFAETGAFTDYLSEWTGAHNDFTQGSASLDETLNTSLLSSYQDHQDQAATARLGYYTDRQTSDEGVLSAGALPARNANPKRADADKKKPTPTRTERDDAKVPKRSPSAVLRPVDLSTFHFGQAPSVRTDSIYQDLVTGKLVDSNGVHLAADRYVPYRKLYEDAKSRVETRNRNKQLVDTFYWWNGLPRAGRTWKEAGIETIAGVMEQGSALNRFVPGLGSQTHRMVAHHGVNEVVASRDSAVTMATTLHSQSERILSGDVRGGSTGLTAWAGGAHEESLYFQIHVHNLFGTPGDIAFKVGREVFKKLDGENYENGKKSAKFIDLVGDVGTAIGGGFVGGGISATGQGVKTLLRRTARQLVVSPDDVKDIFTVGRSALKWIRSLRHADELQSSVNNIRRILGQNRCFPRDTLVQTPSGSRPIGELAAGDYVMAFDFAAGEWVEREIVARHDNHFTGNVVDIEFSDSTVTATVNHPFWVMSGGSLNERPAPDQLEEHESEGLSLDGRWLQSQDLRVGDVVFCRDGETREVMSMAIREADSLPISNLSIREWPNYAVGVGGVLVHNRGLCETDIDELAQVIAAHAPDERPVLIKELADDNVASADLDQIRSKVDELTPRRVFASLDELAQTGRIDPSEIRFSQDSISGTFKNGDSVADLAAKLKNGTVDPSSIPAIRLVERNGKIFTLDNRRLKAFQEAGIEIPYQLLEKIPKREMFKFTTINDGIDIIIRGQ